MTPAYLTGSCDMWVNDAVINGACINGGSVACSSGLNSTGYAAPPDYVCSNDSSKTWRTLTWTCKGVNGGTTASCTGNTKSIDCY